MFDYLQKFNSLPKDLRDKVSSPSIMAALSDLESQYRVDLAMIVMKVMIKEMLVKDLPVYFVSEFAFVPITAEHLTRDLKEKIFAPVAYYLDLMTEIRALDLDKDINLIIKEAGLTFSSDILIGRFRNVLKTYLKGIRNKIDTRATLSKDVKIGGLNLNAAEVDRVFKVCEGHKFKNYDPNESPAAKAAAPVSRLDEIIKKTEKSMASTAAEYNLKEALKGGQVKSEPAPTDGQKKLDPAHELPVPEEQLDLPKPTIKPTSSVPKPSLVSAAKTILTKPPSAAAAPAAPKPSLTPTPARPPDQIARPTVGVPTIAPTAVKPVPAAAPARIITKPPKKSGFLSDLFKSRKKEKKAAPRPPAPVKQSVPINRPAPVNRSVPTVHPIPAAIPSHPISAIRSAPAGRPAPTSSAARPQMHDIKPVPKVMGPIEELQFLDLLNFRRLGKTPPEVTAKILAKIKLLEKDGYDKMVAGVRAWRQSPVNRLYLHLGQEALAKGISLKEAVTAHQTAGQEMLTMEEVEAILGFNSKLTF